MLRKVLAGKIHRATVTGADLSYMGSITVDPALLEKAGIFPLQEVEVWNVNNGERFSTYALPGKRGHGEVIVNGAAARKATRGDVVIIAAYGWVDVTMDTELEARVVMVSKDNTVGELKMYRWNPHSKHFSLEPVEE